MAIKLSGCVDFFNKKGDNLYFGGWCFLSNDDVLHPFHTVVVRNGDTRKEVPFNRTVRDDLKHIMDGHVGFICTLQLSDWDMLLSKQLRVEVMFQD